MKWNQWCDLTIGQQIDALQQWENGDDMDGLEGLFNSFLDDFLFRFNVGSRAELVSDMLLGTVGGYAFNEVKDNFLGILSVGLDVKPLERLKVGE